MTENILKLLNKEIENLRVNIKITDDILSLPIEYYSGLIKRDELKKFSEDECEYTKHIVDNMIKIKKSCSEILEELENFKSEIN